MVRTFLPLRRPANDLAPDLHEALRRAGYRPTWRDDAADLWFAIKAQPYLALTCTLAGFAAGMVAVIVPAIIVAWVSM